MRHTPYFFDLFKHLFFWNQAALPIINCSRPGALLQKHRAPVAMHAVGAHPGANHRNSHRKDEKAACLMCTQYGPCMFSSTMTCALCPGATSV